MEGHKPFVIARADIRDAIVAWEPYSEAIETAAQKAAKAVYDNSLIGVLAKLNAKPDETKQKLEAIKALQDEMQQLAGALTSPKRGGVQGLEAKKR